MYKYEFIVKRYQTAVDMETSWNVDWDARDVELTEELRQQKLALKRRRVSPRTKAWQRKTLCPETRNNIQSMKRCATTVEAKTILTKILNGDRYFRLTKDEISVVESIQFWDATLCNDDHHVDHHIRLRWFL